MAPTIICKKSSGKLKLYEPKTDEAREIVRYARRYPELAVRQSCNGASSKYWHVCPETVAAHRAGAAGRDDVYTAECEARRRKQLRLEREYAAAAERGT